MCGLQRQLAQEVHFHCRVLVMFLSRCLTNSMRCDTTTWLGTEEGCNWCSHYAWADIGSWGKLKTSAG